ncbi:dynamin family protein [Dolichospermum circinale CS-1225]|uniref:dynamin family protein n=1 Tax=Dolichospermum circinale TaxID=109265 RepID=UPI00232BB4D9|nr:dynamin family protein [Dolichospermum circinale]MDB9523531.1 dynamin family protein [Dolichospermum circinale CS-1225]
MSNSVYKVFEEIEFKAKLLAQYWNNFHTEISQHLPESYQPEIQELSNNLEIALNQLIYELQNPTLTLATTGTTSSGKSTLVNLLCGAEIVPVAVSEMSAGAVTIEYSKEKSLIIHETPGALWECGEWIGISDDKIYQRLYKAMISYIENRETQPNLACPQSTITYPFRLLKESQLQLPKGTKVRILDLPGLAYVGDQGNANVIKQCREALCIVTYNSAETDSQKVKSLLQEVVQQVKDLGGSPARMLFALNRIDVFRADRNWPETENRFFENTIRSIKNELTDQLREYTEDIEKLEVVKLSTWPALLSLQIQNQDDIYSADACKKADNHFNGLIEDILEDLPRNTQKWNRHEKKRVAQALWQKSYAEEFQQNLREHINKHFPQLVIPQIIERFNIAAGNAIAEWSTQTTNAVLNSSEERYQEECENISQIRLSIERFLQISDSNLREPFERIDTKIKQVIAEQSEDDPVYYLESTLSEFKNVEPYNLLGEKLIALYDWRRQLGQGINQVLEAVAKSLETGRVDLESTNLKKANLLNVNLLGRNLNRLVNLGYTGSVAKEGKTMEARTDSEKNQLKQINEELNELAIHLNIVMEDVLTQISDQELKRMYQAIEELFNCHLSHIEKGANDIAPNIAIKFPESQLIKVDSQLTFNFRFEAGFPINKGTWQEAVQVEKKKRTWYTLWIGKKTVYETEYRTRSSDNAEIPSVENLLTSWVYQSKKEEREIVNKIASWLLEQIDCLKKNVDKLQNDIIDRYQARLDKANQEITLDYEKQRNVWLPMQKKAQDLAEEFSSLETVLKEEN